MPLRLRSYENGRRCKSSNKLPSQLGRDTLDFGGEFEEEEI
jgi:hypothetical protein